MALLDPDMPVQELRLHMGELTADEVRVARAAIRWANTQAKCQRCTPPTNPPNQGSSARKMYALMREYELRHARG